MKLVMKGIEIPRRPNSLHILGKQVSHLLIDGTLVWAVRKYVKSFRADGEFEVPPNVTTITICACGGGGGGSTTTNDGGYAGSIASNVAISVTPGELIPIIIGAGGTTNNSGGTSSFGALAMAGGAAGSYQGNGDIRHSCGGARADGLLVGSEYGGEASPFAPGGDGGHAGLEGSGGGANAMGGSGKIIITWVKDK